MFTEKIRVITRTTAIGGRQLVGMDMVDVPSEEILRKGVNATIINNNKQTYLDIDGNEYDYDGIDLESTELIDFIDGLPDESDVIIDSLCEFIKRERETSHEYRGFMDTLKQHETDLKVQLTDYERDELYQYDEDMWKKIDAAINESIITIVNERNNTK